ncbi:hypothetical protein LA52FAK_15000 [Desulforhopalus sp. 52FAK]
MVNKLLDINDKSPEDIKMSTVYCGVANKFLLTVNQFQTIYLCWTLLSGYSRWALRSLK